MPLRSLLAALLLIGAAHRAGARDLAIVLQEGDWIATLQQAYLRPFASVTDMKLHAGQSWDGRIETLRAAVKNADTGWDLVLLPSDAVATACEEGLLETLDWSAIGGKEHYRERAVSKCGVSAFVAATVLAWDRDKFAGTPGWAEFWDVAKIPGRRGLFRGPRGALEFALLADGVAPGDVYGELRTEDGVARAFHRLDQLRPFIVWWETGAQAAQLLRDGEVLMTSAPYAGILTTNQESGRHFGVQWAGGLARSHAWAIFKDSPNRRQAEQFLYFAGLPALQARLVGYGGLAKGVAELLDPAAQAELVTSKANLSALLTVDEAFWREHAERLGARFASWLGR